jgi:hypothetical protein
MQSFAPSSPQCPSPNSQRHSPAPRRPVHCPLRSSYAGRAPETVTNRHGPFTAIAFGPALHSRRSLCPAAGAASSRGESADARRRQETATDTSAALSRLPLISMKGCLAATVSAASAAPRPVPPTQLRARPRPGWDGRVRWPPPRPAWLPGPGPARPRGSGR